MKHTNDCVEHAVMRTLLSLWKPELRIDDHVRFGREMHVDPKFYSDVSTFKKDYVLHNLLRKWKGRDGTEQDPDRVAFDAWTSSEYHCTETNILLTKSVRTGFDDPFALSVFLKAQRKIAAVLGDVNWDLLTKLCRFGNGATATLKRGSTHADKTYRPSITASAIPYACIVLANDAWIGDKVGGLDDLQIVRGNRMVMVPKTYKTHRPIACEPTLNGFIQQGIGRYIRRRLKKFGVDLDDQTINQDRARRAQADSLATIDLQSASDSLSRSLVEILLPPAWFEILEALRSPVTTFNGRTYYLEKFSSMGNAFTFELESLVFWALAQSACWKERESLISVYGDDIICHQLDAQHVIRALKAFGFIVNSEKTYVDGRFFESCGKHYFDGVEVTPLYQKEICKSKAEYIRFYNRLVRASVRLQLPELEYVARLHIVPAYVKRFGKATFGPPVQHDQYFIDPNFVWGDRDSVRLPSVVTLTRCTIAVPPWKEEAYLGLRLRSGSCSSASHPKGWIAEPLRELLTQKVSRHWRSACTDDWAAAEMPRPMSLY